MHGFYSHKPRGFIVREVRLGFCYIFRIGRTRDVAKTSLSSLHSRQGQGREIAVEPRVQATALDHKKSSPSLDRLHIT